MVRKGGSRISFTPHSTTARSKNGEMTPFVERPSPPRALKSTQESPFPEGYSVGGGAGASAGRGAAGGFMAALSCLDHLSSVGPPYFVNQVVQRNLSGPSRSAASRHAKRCPTMRDGRWGGSGAGRRNRPAARTVRLPGPDDPSKPDRPRRPTRRSRRAPHPPTHPEETRAGHQG